MKQVNPETTDREGGGDHGGRQKGRVRCIFYNHCLMLLRFFSDTFKAGSHFHFLIAVTCPGNT